MGSKWKCPSCQTLYFAYWTRESQFWTSPYQASQETFLDELGQPYHNEHKDKFVTRDSKGRKKDTGFYTITLIYYHPTSVQSEWKECVEEDETQLVRFYPDILY